MKIYTVEECQEFITEDKYLPFYQKKFYKEGKSWNIYLANISDHRHCYHHNIDRVKWNIEKLQEKYPPINKILEIEKDEDEYRNKRLELYFCPLPNLGFQNAEVWNGNRDIVFYARCTQIPRSMTDYVTIHELGHIIQYYYACDHREDTSKWREYLKLRNAPRDICTIYDHWDEDKKIEVYREEEDFVCMNSKMGNHEKYPHYWHERPIEHFAEDFRYFFNNINDDYWGLEEYGIPKPDEKIKELMLNLGE